MAALRSCLGVLLSGGVVFNIGLRSSGLQWSNSGDRRLAAGGSLLIRRLVLIDEWRCHLNDLRSLRHRWWCVVRHISDRLRLRIALIDVHASIAHPGIGAYR